MFVPSNVMPLILEKKISSDLAIGVWQVKEAEEWFLGQTWLSAMEREDLAMLKSKAKREQRLAYRMVLIHLLGRHDFIIKYDQHHKPHLENIPGHISVSHSGELAAAMINQRSPAGIDIERISNRILSLSEKFLSLQECINSGGRKNADLLTLYWGAKEALYKMDGKKGLTFKEDLLIDDFTPAQEGVLTGRITRGMLSGSHTLEYQHIRDYVLVHTV